ncbi:unnamed protein product [Paramecium primaurelia]|uniref:Uncharacterized protein n=1 Tax=Paramecium primaurelia TaxID=5886 RepID=A0A8S1JQS0_PARPR|nr:unnamed protein product [Paramecium primaurelia]
MSQEQLEQLLYLKQYQINQNNVPNFDLLPIQPTYIQEMNKEVENLEQQSLFADQLNVDILSLKRIEKKKDQEKWLKYNNYLKVGFFE